MSFIEPECTKKCKSKKHANELIKVVTKGRSTTEIISCLLTCYNCGEITDDMGRSVLHMAASCGKVDVINWLVKYKSAKLNLSDLESGYTPLHYAASAGQIHAFNQLHTLGGDMYIEDNDGFTPIDQIVKDQPDEAMANLGQYEVVTWGSNNFFNLGHERESPKSSPEVVEFFRKQNVVITQVYMERFHTVFVSSDGHVYSCGLGTGGRLGHGTEHSCLVPELLLPLKDKKIVSVSLTLSDSHFLTDKGELWSTFSGFGGNMCAATEKIVKLISYKHMELHKIESLSAGLYHLSLVFDKKLYTFGINFGQLGHPKNERIILSPKIVSIFNNSDNEVLSTLSTDAALAVHLKSGLVVLLNKYKVIKISLRTLHVKKMCLFGGRPKSCDCQNMAFDGMQHELRFLVLTECYDVYLWHEADLVFRRCVWDIKRPVIVTDVFLNREGVALCSKDGLVYTGALRTAKIVKAFQKVTQQEAERPSAAATNADSVAVNKKDESFKTVKSFKDDFCHHTYHVNMDSVCAINLKRIKHLYRTFKITSDPYADNFAGLKYDYKSGLQDWPTRIPSTFMFDMKQLFHDARKLCSDLVIETYTASHPSKRFAVHRFILASCSNVFKKMILSESSAVLHFSFHPDVIHHLLEFMYYGTCSVIVKTDIKSLLRSPLIDGDAKCDGKRKNSTDRTRVGNGQIVNNFDVTSLMEGAKFFKLNSLQSELKRFESKKDVAIITVNTFRPELKRKEFSDFYDFSIVCEDGVVEQCHKCMLIARTEYFRNMLAFELSKGNNFSLASLPFSSLTVRVFLNYVYCDRLIPCSDNTEELIEILVLADFLLLEGLKSLCEIELVNRLNFKNAVMLYSIAYLYNAQQLKSSLNEFIFLNLAAFVESRHLNQLGDQLLQELSTYVSKQVIYEDRHMSSIENEPDLNTFKIVDADFFSEDFRGLIRDLEFQKPMKKPELNGALSRNEITDLKTRDGILCHVENKQPLNSASEDKWRAVIKRKPKKDAKKNMNMKDMSIKENVVCPLVPNSLTFNINAQHQSIPHSPSSDNYCDVKARNKSYTICWKAVEHPSSSSYSVSFTEFPPLPAEEREVLQRNSISHVDAAISEAVDDIKTHSGTSSCRCSDEIKNSPISLMDIQSEQRFMEERPHQSKPFHLIQLEDKAIEELRNYYDVENTFDYYVTISRTVARNNSPPYQPLKSWASLL